jgi:ribosomal-protein-alanine N-acetyltransferase
MQIDDIDQVYAIELMSHRAPWTRNILCDCLLVRYDCRVLELPGLLGYQIAGYLICRYDQDVCHVLNLCIAPDVQKSGYGHFLLSDLLDSLSGSCLQAVILEVRPSNPAAIHLYKKLNFLKVDIKKDYYCDEQGIEDAIILEKKLG